MTSHSFTESTTEGENTHMKLFSTKQGGTTSRGRPTSSPRLSWTRRRVSAPAPEERREAARVPLEAESPRARRSPAPPRAVHLQELRHHRRPLRKLRHHRQPVSRSEHGLLQGPRIDHLWWPSVVCSLERTAPYRTSQTNTRSA